jgi:hypothetical protein
MKNYLTEFSRSHFQSATLCPAHGCRQWFAFTHAIWLRCQVSSEIYRWLFLSDDRQF